MSAEIQSKLPNIIIGGVFKAATTSLFAYLTLHPDVCGSSRKETRFFTEVAKGENPPAIEEYAAYFNECQNARYRLEASPDYFYGKGDVARVMHDTLGPDTKVIFLLRDPVERSISHFRHEKKFLYMDKDVSFDTYIDEWRQIEEYTEENNYYFPLQGSRYADYLPPWFEVFGDNARVLWFSQMKHDREGLLRDLAEWLDIDPELFPFDQMHIENVTTGYKNPVLQRVALEVNRRGETFWRKNPGLKRSLKKAYTAINGQKADETPDDAHMIALAEAYIDSNAQLAELLTGRGYTDLPTWVQVERQS